MNGDTNATLTIELLFGKTAQVGRFLKDASDAQIRKNILRARVTSNGAWMTVGLEGPADGVARLLARWRDSVSAVRGAARRSA